MYKVEPLGSTTMLGNSLSQKKTIWEMWLCVKNCFKACLNIKITEWSYHINRQHKQCIPLFISHVSIDRRMAVPFQTPGWANNGKGANNGKVGVGKQLTLSKRQRRRKEPFSKTKKRASESVLASQKPGVMWPSPGRSQHSHGSASLSAHTHHAWI